MPVEVVGREHHHVAIFTSVIAAAFVGCGRKGIELAKLYIFIFIIQTPTRPTSHSHSAEAGSTIEVHILSLLGRLSGLSATMVLTPVSRAHGRRPTGPTQSR